MTPPTLNDIYSQHYNGQEEVTTTPPVVSINESTSRKTLVEIQDWAKSINTSDPNVQIVLDRIKGLSLGDGVNIEGYRTQIQSLFGMIHDIPEGELSENFIAMQKYLNDIEALYQTYLIEIAAISGDSETRREIMAPAELSDDIDWGSEPWYWFADRVMDSFDSAEALFTTLPTESAERRVMALTTSIEISRSITLEDTDEYFEDLISNNQLSRTEQTELEAYIANYKATSKFYKHLEAGNTVDLGDVGNVIDAAVTAAVNGEDASPFEVTIVGDEYTFNSKQEFLLAMYQLKLHLSVIEPNMLEYYILNPYAGVLVGGIISAGLSTLGFIYAKDYLVNRAERINQGLKDADIARMTNTENTGSLDKIIKRFQDAGYSDSEIRGLVRLQGKMRGIRIDAATPDDVMKAQGLAYRYLARFRGRVGNLFSIGGTMMKPIKATKPARFLRGIAFGSINKGPEGNFGGWQWQTQREVFDKYVSGFDDFDKTIQRVVDTLETDHRLGSELRGKIEKAILGVYIDKGAIYKFRGARVRPFRDRFKKVEQILGEHISLSGDIETFIRMLKGEVTPEIASLLPDVEKRVKFLPEVSDNAERNFFEKLREYKHIKRPADFRIKINEEIGNLGIPGVTNIAELNRIEIKDSSVFNTDAIASIRQGVREDIKNFGKITRYLETTTEGHKGLIIYNIARIMDGQEVVKNIPLAQADSILASSSLSSINTSRLSQAVRGQKAEILVLGGGVAPVDPVRPAPVDPVRPAPVETNRPRGVDIYFDGETLRTNSHARAFQAVSITTGISITELRSQIGEDTTPAQARDNVNAYLTSQSVEYRMLREMAPEELIDIEKLVLSDRIIRSLTGARVNITETGIDAMERYISSLPDASEASYDLVNTSIKNTFGIDIDINTAPEWETIGNRPDRLTNEMLLDLQNIRNHAHTQNGMTGWRTFFRALKGAAT